VPCILFLKTWYNIKTQVEKFTQVYEMFTQMEMLGLFWPDFLDPKKIDRLDHRFVEKVDRRPTTWYDRWDFWEKL